MIEPATRNPEVSFMFDIIATDGTGQDIHCFTWTRSPESGVERAKVDAVAFDRLDLHNFRALPVTDPARLGRLA